ncbi:MAG: UDP-2,3-diacylglucosamine diphosphatase LpxI [Rhodospirillaceae bacterium]|nr:UDP-2,3-diacylglucosamine diphosphatase LpxI [Rhodospirillaceae bacterium]
MLGTGRAAQEVAKTIQATHKEVELACWRSAARIHQSVSTVNWTVTIKNIDSFSDRFVSSSINKVCLIGRVSDQDIRQPSDRESLAALLRDGATLPKVLRRLAQKVSAKGIEFSNLSREFPEFSIEDFVDRRADTNEIGWFKKVRHSADSASGVIVPDSAVVFDNDQLEMEKEDGVDALLDRIGAHGFGKAKPSMLVKTSPSGLGAILPCVIGPRTIKKAATAGIGLILVDAECTVLVERNQFGAELSARGVKLISIN